MYWFRSSDLGNITATTWTYQPPSPLVFLLIPKCYKAISFPISSSCRKLFTGTYWQASSIQCLDGAQVVEWTGVDQKEWHEGFSEGEVIGLALLIGWECWERFDAGDFLGSMYYTVIVLPSLQPSKSFSLKTSFWSEIESRESRVRGDEFLPHECLSLRYYIPYDRVYEKYLLKIRVRWLDKHGPSRCHHWWLSCSTRGTQCICMFVLSSPSPITNVSALEVHTFRTMLNTENQPLMPSLQSWALAIYDQWIIINHQKLRAKDSTWQE